MPTATRCVLIRCERFRSPKGTAGFPLVRYGRIPRALACAVAWIVSGGSIDADRFVPLFTVGDHVDLTDLESLLAELGAGCENTAYTLFVETTADLGAVSGIAVDGVNEYATRSDHGDSSSNVTSVRMRLVE